MNEQSKFSLEGLSKPLTPEEEVSLSLDLEKTELQFWELVLSHSSGEEVKAAVQKASWRRHYVKSNKIHEAVGRALVQTPARAGKRLRLIDSDRWLAREAERKTGSQRAKGAWQEANRIRNRYVEANLRLVYTISGQMAAKSRFPHEDLFQEGALGLMTAVNRFNPRKGFRFSTYAGWWIRHHMQRMLADKSREVRLPVGLIQKRKMYTELAEGEGPEAKKAREVMAYLSTRVVSFNARRQGAWGEGHSLEETLPAETEDPANNLAQEQLSAALDKCLSRLSFEDRELLRRRFGLHGRLAERLEDIAAHPHFPRKNKSRDGKQTFTRQLVQQREARALVSLRKSLVRAGISSASAVCP